MASHRNAAVAEAGKYQHGVGPDEAMQAPPDRPHVDDAPPDLFDGGHLWVQERVVGGHCRFRLAETGVVRFGDRERVFESDGVPAPYRHTVRHVRERLDREALRSAAERVGDVVFFGVSTHDRGVDYDWDRLPSFLGYEVWSGADGAFLPPDRAEQAFSKLGLTPVNAVAKEVRAADFDPETYAFPESRWYDGPAAGVVLRNKTGARAELPNPAVGTRPESEPGATDFDPEARAESWATDSRFEAVADDVTGQGSAVTVDAVYDRVLESILREHHRELLGATDEQRRAFRSAVAALTREFAARQE
ncbi:hypothetical protein [Halostella salina]|uniref:hypothetical protein n=1 Tax=Halostella salina TaxID=1547897 RepID=UPI001F099776|nr:hypothetical protein [Halostella salina]